MRKTKQLLYLCLTVIMIMGMLSLISGCGSSGSSKRSENSGGDKNEEVKVDDNTDKSDEEDTIDYVKESKKASGTYTYDNVNGNLMFDVISTEFSGCGPGLGQQEFTVQSLSSTQMVWDVANIQLGIYDGSTFEFELEFIIPEAAGEYIVGHDLYAVDFMNDDTPYNLHAYGGTITISSVSHLFKGEFELNSLMTRHDNKPEAQNIDGNISGNFSVPADGSANGIFTAVGTAGEHAVDINVKDAFVISEKMIWARDDGAENDVIGTWKTTNGEFYATFNSDGTFEIEGNCYRWDQ